MILTIGVVGYSGQSFDKDEAQRALRDAFSRILDAHPDCDQTELVSGLTNVGVPALAYKIATETGWKTVGVACAKAAKYDCYPVDEQIVRPEWLNWGDESLAFLARITSVPWQRVGVLVRIGGGKRSYDEVAAYRRALAGTVYEYDLPSW